MKLPTFVPYLLLAAIILVLGGVAIVLPKASPSGCKPPAIDANLQAVRFIDSLSGSDLVLQLNAQQPKYGSFTYQTTQGDQYSGAPVQGLHASSHDFLTCAGVLHLTYTGKAALLSASGMMTTVRAQLVADVNLAHYTASITLRDQSNNRTFQTTTHPPPNEDKAVQSFSGALATHNWQSLYQMTSQNVLQNESAAQFQNALQAQEAEMGTVISISDFSTPQIGSNPAGIIYFTVNQHLTMQHNGETQMQDVTSVFVLEHGVWKYWFSQPIK